MGLWNWLSGKAPPDEAATEETTTTVSPKTKWLTALLLSVSIMVGLGLFEIIVRAVEIDYNLSPNWRLHPVLGWSQVPNGTYDFHLEGRPVNVTFNSLGFRDTDHELAKPPGVKRIVFIGDSFLEAIQVNLEETFQERLETLLNEQGETQWEVINLGIGDFGTGQAYIALREYGLAFDPDVVIHEIFPLNDICNNSIEMYGLCRSHNDRYRPYFVESDGDLRQTYAQPIRTWLRRHVVSYSVMEYWMLKIAGADPHSPDDPSRDGRMRARGFNSLDPLLYTFVNADEQPESVAQGWRITEKLVERIVRMTGERGIAYVGMVIPFELRLPPRWDEFVGIQPPPPMSRKYPEERFAALFDRLGVGSVMLIDEFEPYLDEVLPYVGGHLSVAGHQRAAEALYRRLVETGIAAP